MQMPRRRCVVEIDRGPCGEDAWFSAWASGRTWPEVQAAAVKSEPSEPNRKALTKAVKELGAWERNDRPCLCGYPARPYWPETVVSAKRLGVTLPKLCWNCYQDRVGPMIAHMPRSRRNDFATHDRLVRLIVKEPAAEKANGA